MRKISEIRKDLNEAVIALKGVDRNDKEAREAAMTRVNELMNELEETEVAERAAQALAEDRFRAEEKKEKRRFSIVKFVNETISGALSGLEAKAAEEGADPACNADNG